MLEATVANHRTLSDTTSLVHNDNIDLLDLLLNRLVLENIVAYLPVSSLLNLASVNRDYRSLVYESPGIFRYLDISKLRTLQFDTSAIDQGSQVWRNVQLDENLTEDDFYSGPLRGVFSCLLRRNILQDVQTLVLDGLSVTAELCNDIIQDACYSVQILSIREVKSLNHGKLRQTLQYACRPSRPEGTPRLKALYVFGSKDVAKPSVDAPERRNISSEWNHKSQRALTSSLESEGDAWWHQKGGMVRPKRDMDGWATCLLACQGIIAFDAILCEGPRHYNSPAFGQVSTQGPGEPEIAIFALSACEGCGKSPEGMIEARGARHRLPLLSPPPILSSSLRAATTPMQPAQSFAARCKQCLHDRFCMGCNKWWCESCYTPPSHSVNQTETVVALDDDGVMTVSEYSGGGVSIVKPKALVTKSCWECGQNCESCIDHTQRMCRRCGGGYCVTHNEGCTLTHCDWCTSRGRGLGRL